jgi:FKBP-type peptidyl-prolyl cis-trans isomerase
MKKIFITMCCLGLAAPLFADGTNQLSGAGAPASTNGASQLRDEKSRISYALGMLNGHQWKMQELDFDPDVYIRGIKDGLAGGQTLLTAEEAQQTLDGFKKQFMAKQQAKQKEMAAKQKELGVKNKADGDAFLATNKLAPGVKLMSVTLPNGQTSELQYQVLTNGTGPIPKATDRVKVNYRGSLLDGTEFDSSFKRGEPATFGVTGVIKGWTEALKNMPVGSDWKLFIPADLAYGESGRPGIPPNSVLIFEVELLDIEAPAPPPPPPPAPAAPLTSDIIKVPSADELKKGAKIEVIKAEDVQKMQSQQQTNK